MTSHSYVPYGATVLTAFNSVAVKTYSIDSHGALQTVPYGQASYFSTEVRSLDGITSLGQLVATLSKHRNKLLIRGQPQGSHKSLMRRNTQNYEEPPEGLHWAMLDFDGIPLPNDLPPDSIDAIQYVIAKLPEPFQRACCFYQFSSSTGIFRPDGTRLKDGLNVHLFFWFSCPIPGKDLSAYLRKHCIETGFFERTFDRAGVPIIRYGIDLSLFRTVQPHYTAAPIIRDGVTSTLPEDKRQGFIRNDMDSVVLPEPDAELVQRVQDRHRQLLDGHRRSSGWVLKKTITKATGRGIAIGYYYQSPEPDSVRRDRKLVDVAIKEKTLADGRTVTYATLYFEDESSPGSWYISNESPTIARRFGDYAQMHLRELSPSAYAYVCEELKWITEIEQKHLSLNEQGFLPDFTTFVNAENSLILAPTGSGKTTAFCRFVAANPTKRIVYAAQTIALTRQMEDDLRAAQVRVVHYSEFNPYQDIDRPGVFVTTNESLHKFITALKNAGYDYTLVVDEAHAALDDFLSTDKKYRLLEDALSRAQQSIFMTATMTDMQTKKLLETVARAKGELTPERMGYYGFAPFKSNPLWWCSLDRFGEDLVALLRHYADLKAAGQAIPRTILLLPTSKMRPYELLLEFFGLSEDADVVSRVERTQEVIDAARVSSKPLLISSPLFALGLNFVHPPARFWTNFGQLDVDTSQIVQTLNRANRTDVPCEVRLYAGRLDNRPVSITPEMQEKLRVEGYFLEETSFEGVLDSHFQVGRMAYNALRDCEKDTGKSLFLLKANDGFQNYRVVEDWEETLAHESDDGEFFNRVLHDAKESYDNDISVELPKYAGERFEILSDYLEKIGERSRDFRAADVVPKELKDQRRAILQAVIGSDDVRQSGSVRPIRMQRLHGEARVYLSEQYAGERTEAWRGAAIEKTNALIKVVDLIEKLKDGALTGIEFAFKMRTKANRQGVLALADSNSNFLHWQRKLADLDELAQKHTNNASKAQRPNIEGQMFNIAREFLASIGIGFAKTKGNDGYHRIDPSKPCVPNWNFDSMRRRLSVKAKSLKTEPYERPNSLLVDLGWKEPPVNLEKCRQCAHCNSSLMCILGRPTQAFWDMSEPTFENCDAFKKLPAKLHWPIPSLS